MTPELRFALYNWEWIEGRDPPKPDCIPYQLQLLFAKLQTVDSRDVETKELTHSFGWAAADGFEQQDCNEAFNVLTDALESCFRGTRGDGVIQALFGGRQRDYIECLRCGHQAGAGEATFQNIIVPVKPFGAAAIGSLEEGLARVFAAERLSGDNQYNCDGCGSRADADKGLTLSKVPYILSFTLGRIEYDWQADRMERLQASRACSYDSPPLLRQQL
jgi:uncharacterized UBP type Zn finger protein